jgi:RNA polymerase sigma factor (sigma-70 family)
LGVIDATTSAAGLAMSPRPLQTTDDAPRPRLVALDTPRLAPAAFGEALQREAPILLAAARAIVRDDREAEDLVQTTFEIAVRHADELRDPAAIRAWLLRIETREAFRLRRRLARIVRWDPAVADLTTRPTGDLETLDVRSAVRRLPARMRAAVVLHHLVGLTIEETADALGTSRNTVKTQVRVGLARLREELRDD